jgi:hypothetical protein
MRQVEVLESNLLDAIKKLWKTDIQSKVNVFGWRLLLNRLPTRAALNRRDILVNSHNNLLCVFCFLNVDNTTHLIFSCQFNKGVWNGVFKWIRKNFPTGVELWNHFMLFDELLNSRKSCILFSCWCLDPLPCFCFVL